MEQDHSIMSISLEKLPIEIISSIFHYLDFRSLINVMTLNSLYFQLSSQFLLSGQFNKEFKLPEEQCIFLITTLLELFKKQQSLFTLNRIDLTNFNILQKKDQIFELVIELIKSYEITEFVFDFSFFSEKQELLFKTIYKNLTLVKAKNMTYSFIDLLSNNEENHLQHLYINHLPYNFTNYHVLQNLKTLDLSFESCKNLKKFSFVCYQSFKTAINWCFPENDETVLNYLKEKITIFPNLKELKLIVKSNEKSQHFLKYFVNENSNLDKLTIIYPLFKTLFERMNKINELKILYNSYEDKNESLHKKNNIPIEVNKLIIQAKLTSKALLLLLDELKLKDIYFIDATIDESFTSCNDYILEHLNELKIIYIYKSKIFIPVLEFLITKSENGLQKLTLLKSELISNNKDKNSSDLQKIERLKQQSEKYLKDLRYFKIESCKNDYDLFYLFLLQYNLPKLTRYFINDCFNITGLFLEYSFTKIHMSNLIELEILGSPLNDNSMLTVLTFLNNDQYQNKIKLNLDGQITEKGLIAIPKEIRKKIIQLKLFNSSINITENKNDVIDFLNDLNDELTVCCLNFREFGPTKEILKVISNKFKELRILNIQGKMEIEKTDLFELIKKLQKIELIYFGCSVNNCTNEEIEEFKNSIRLTNRLAPKIIIPMKYNSASSKEIIRNPPKSNCLLM
ncbi:hypothetical protein ABK040_007562 [Willaertia magna]